MASNGFAAMHRKSVSSQMPSASSGNTLDNTTKPNATSAADIPSAKASLVAVIPRTLLATAAATASAVVLFLLSRAIFKVPYDWLNLAEVVVIPMLVAFPIAAYIFHQTDRLAAARVALAQQARDNERQRLMIQELNHRVKNVLATVMSICTQTARGTPEVEMFAQAFNRRLVALAAAHDVLSRGDLREKVSLAELSAQILAPYGERVEAKGPPVFLPSAAAVPLSLVLHELATNATKHGALSSGGSKRGKSGGRVTVEWTMNNAFVLKWTESGGPAVKGDPTRTGFGSKLIRHVVEHELGGSLHIEYHPDGLRLSLNIPATRMD